MPRLTRWFVRTALIYCVLGLFTGLLLAARAAFPLPAALAALSPVYFHLLMVGWVTQLIFGIAFWMLPKYTLAQPRGNENVGWAAYWLLNIGLALRVAAEPLNALGPHPVWGWGVAVSATLQWLGGMAFVINAWPRVKEK